MKTTLLLAMATLADGTMAISAESHTQDIACEIYRKTDEDGNPCKGKVTRGSTNSSGITYSCSKGHTFTVEPKTRVK